VRFCAVCNDTRRFERFVFEDEPIRFEDIFGLPGVFPPASHDVRVDFVAIFEQGLNSVRNFEFPSPRRFEVVDSIEDRRRKDVHADQCEICR
jgi:hypothetical protein